MNHRYDDDAAVPALRGISQASCVELLQSQTVGRVAWQAGDGPELLPVNYVWHEDAVIFRTSPKGRLSELVQATDVAFEIDGLNQQRREGWSVVVHGRTQEVDRSERLAQLWTGAAAADVVPWAAGDRSLYIRIVPTRVTGRSIAARSG